jgi:hypothetical protein
MKSTKANRFKKLYQRHLRLFKLQGKSQKTIDAYSRAVRRVSDHFDCCPDKLTPKQLEKIHGSNYGKSLHHCLHFRGSGLYWV